jgi:hypothetical protein
MLQQLLNSLTAKTIKSVATPRPAQVRQIVETVPAPAPDQRTQLAEPAPPNLRIAPRSVCTSLKDLCEL